MYLYLSNKLYAKLLEFVSKILRQVKKPALLSALKIDDF